MPYGGTSGHAQSICGIAYVIRRAARRTGSETP
jgi:hypothetical protein